MHLRNSRRSQLCAMDVLPFSVSAPALLWTRIQGKGQVPHKIPTPFSPFPTLSFLSPEPVVDGKWTLSPLLKPENSAQLQQSFEVYACCILNRLAKEFSAVDAEDHWQIMLSTAHREIGLCEKAKPYWNNEKPGVLILSRSLSQTCSQAQFCNVMMCWIFPLLSLWRPHKDNPLCSH